MLRRLILPIIIIFTLTGCATLRRAVPVDLQEKAEVVGMPHVRAFSDASNERIIEDIILSIRQESDNDYPVGKNGMKLYPMLTISGGGANGAYGAGIMKGWTEEGTRPKFKIIAGISAGALTAPFVFLGSEYDPDLESFFTTMKTDYIMKFRSIFRLPFSNAFAGNHPLEKLIAGEITEEMLKKIADEHNRGRRLYMGTTNLDAQRLVMWDMGAIANIGDDKALRLFRKIMLTSAAIPAVFPPTILNVEVDGKRYDEMHVDGGAMAQSFFLYGVLKGFKETAKESGVDRDKITFDLYVIRNGYTKPSWKEVRDRIGPITNRTVDTMINTQGMGDIFRLHYFTTKGGGNFYYAHIPNDFDPNAKEFFDPKEMRRLFDRGYEDAQSGYNWKREPEELLLLKNQ